MVVLNREIVEQLSNGIAVVKIEIITDTGNKRNFYTLLNDGQLFDLIDLNGNLSNVHFFDTYEVNQNNEILIGILRNHNNYCKNVMPLFELNEDKCPSRYDYLYGAINSNGCLAIYPERDYISFGNENTCIVGNLCPYSPSLLKYGYVDLNSGVQLTPVCFDEALGFSENKAAVKYNGKWGYVDRTKIISIPSNFSEYPSNLWPRFIRVSSFANNKATVVPFRGNIFEEAPVFEINHEGEIIPDSIQFRKRQRPNK